MKHLMILILAGVMGTGLVACGNNDSKMTTETATTEATTEATPEVKPAAVVEESAPVAQTEEAAPATTEATKAE